VNVFIPANRHRTVIRYRPAGSAAARSSVATGGRW
jgi:hypothetical protein